LNSAAATAHVETLSEAIRITALTRLEFENAIRLLRFRRVLPETEAAAALAALAADEQAGRIIEIACDWRAVVGEAMRISGRGRSRKVTGCWTSYMSRSR
jgi:hypothetical protein